MTQITLNGRKEDVPESTVFALRDRVSPGGYAVVDGFSVSSDVGIRDGMSVCIFSKDSLPDREEYEALMSARDSPGLYERWRDSTVGIAGLGGLGSNIAMILARIGVGHFVIADMDTVDITNLNRQNYYGEDVGSFKGDATARALKRINPFADVRVHNVKLDESNSIELFSGCDAVVEALDSADQKLMFISALLEKTDRWVFSGNGVAGLGPSNSILTSRPMDRLVMCGDGESEAEMGTGLMAPRVMVAAAHQANAVARFLAGLDPVG